MMEIPILKLKPALSAKCGITEILFCMKSNKSTFSIKSLKIKFRFQAITSNAGTAKKSGVGSVAMMVKLCSQIW
jgi:hypothetical protein